MIKKWEYILKNSRKKGKENIDFINNGTNFILFGTPSVSN